MTGATSTIRGELVDVRQCHGAQWNIHRSAFGPPSHQPRPPTPAWVTSPHLPQACTHRSLSKGPIGQHMSPREMRRWRLGGDTELGQATCKPKSRPQRPPPPPSLPISRSAEKGGVDTAQRLPGSWEKTNFANTFYEGLLLLYSALRLPYKDIA